MDGHGGVSESWYEIRPGNIEAFLSWMLAAGYSIIPCDPEKRLAIVTQYFGVAREEGGDGNEHLVAKA